MKNLENYIEEYIDDLKNSKLDTSCPTETSSDCNNLVSVDYIITGLEGILEKYKTERTARWAEG